MREVVAFLFGLGFVFNASLFIPQALRILKTKSGKNISLMLACLFPKLCEY